MPRRKRIAILTAGGDCPGLNAVIRAVVKTAQNVHGWDVYGVRNGTEGFMEPHGHGLYRLSREDIAGLLPRGGTILGANNRFEIFNVKEGQGPVGDQSDRAVKALKRRGITALITVGGDGTHRMARRLMEKGVPIVGVPKTIDNDIQGTDRTFGFDSAVSVVTEAIDRLYTTAESHHRAMLVEVMGRDSGFIALHGGIAGGAEAILLPEIPYDPDRLADVVRVRAKRGRRFSIIVVSEGARLAKGKKTYQDTEDGTRKRLGGVSAMVQAQLESRTELEVRNVVLGHTQRGGSPTAYDRVLATAMGSHAVTLEQATRSVRKVDPKGQNVQIARDMGISFAAADGADDALTKRRRRFGAP